jgi:hypothetical protein
MQRGIYTVADPRVFWAEGGAVFNNKEMKLGMKNTNSMKEWFILKRESCKQE